HECRARDSPLALAARLRRPNTGAFPTRRSRVSTSEQPFPETHVIAPRRDPRQRGMPDATRSRSHVTEPCPAALLKRDFEPTIAATRGPCAAFASSANGTQNAILSTTRGAVCRFVFLPLKTRDWHWPSKRPAALLTTIIAHGLVAFLFLSDPTLVC